MTDRLVLVVLEVADVDPSVALYRDAFGVDLHVSDHEGCRGVPRPATGTTTATSSASRSRAAEKLQHRQAAVTRAEVDLVSSSGSYRAQTTSRSPSSRHVSSVGRIWKTSKRDVS